MMLRCVRRFLGYRMLATDGPIGHARDLYFDDAEWTTRYLVVDTSKWLPGREVLIAPDSLGRPDWSAGVIPVSLTKQQLEESPSITSDKPLSRQMERQLALYYGWPIYWGPVEPVYASMANMPPGLEAATAAKLAIEVERKRGDSHLRSVKSILGDTIHAIDGHIGHIEDFIVDDVSWILRYVVIDTRKWLPGRHVILAPTWFEDIRWDEAAAHVAMTKEQIRNAPEFVSSEPINRDFEGRLYDYYGRPCYWE